MTKIDMRIDLEGLAARLQARTNSVLDPPMKQLLEEAAAALIQAHTLLVTFPVILDNKRASTGVEIASKIATAMISIADQYDSGEMSITTPGNAVRSFAASLAKAIMTPEEDRGKKKSTLIGLHS